MTETLWSDPISFPTALEQAAKVTDAALERLLIVPPDLEARVYDAMRYSALAPGKRLRPFLVLASARLFGVMRRCALQVAAAIEMVHAYSLVHDDLPAMDDSDLRRGRQIALFAFQVQLPMEGMTRSDPCQPVFQHGRLGVSLPLGWLRNP